MTASTTPDCLVADLPYRFCPGCSHGRIVDTLGTALSASGTEKQRMVLVSDIGCVGLVDQHFDINTFHGLHGRAITYGTGLKLARPALRVVVVVGDGGCGIGGGHLIQAARRDIDLTVVVFNNFNYGMTGGEHSCTTPAGAVTSSTPDGNSEQGLDLCALAAAAGGGFVARATAFDNDLSSTLTRAIEHPGFALIDVWEVCTAYYMPNNNFKKKAMLSMAQTSGMEFGILRAERRERRPIPATTAVRRTDLTPAHTAQLARSMQLVIAGSAGQKIKSTATTLARAAILSGLYATQKDDYPITVKTGHSLSALNIAPGPIRFTGIERPDIAAVLSADGWRRARGYLMAMSKDGVVYVDNRLEVPNISEHLRYLDIATMEKRVGKEFVALWILGRLLAEWGAIPVAALEDTMARFATPKLRDRALRAIELGADSAVPVAAAAAITPTVP